MRDAIQKWETYLTSSDDFGGEQSAVENDLPLFVLDL